MDDDAALTAWLSVFMLSRRTTARSYRSQSKKFRLFLSLLHPDRPPQHQLKLATELDVVAYEAALSHRSQAGLNVAALRLAPEQMQRFHLTRQPFVAPLKRSSVNQALAVIHAMYDFLRQPNAAMPEPYVTVNPCRRVLKAGSRTPQKIDRVLPAEAIKAMQDYLTAAIEESQKQSDQEALRHLRRQQWILALLFGLWARRDEICKLKMGDFLQQADGSWRVRLQRKGGSEQSIPVPSWILEHLKRYRSSVELPDRWSPDDSMPALLDVRSRSASSRRGVSAHTLYVQVKALAWSTANEIEAKMLLHDASLEDRERVIYALRRCSPHWFRHTGPTMAINAGHMSLTNASALLGHASIATTTAMYHHADEQQTRQGMESLGRLIN
jgi:integrase